MTRTKVRALIVLGVSAISCSAQNSPPQQPGFEALINRVIARESALLTTLRGKQPIAETYIQEMVKDNDFGAVPKTDHYFLGRMDLTHPRGPESLIPVDTASRAHQVFSSFFSPDFLFRGFAQMMLIDDSSFDRAHYDFQFRQREFLGDVRTWVIDVSPKPHSGSGRFKGRIWVEDRGSNVVRFDGIYSGSPGLGKTYLHFDSWRVNCGPDLWVPYETYSEESDLSYNLGGKLHYKAITRFWGYTRPEDRDPGFFTNIAVDTPGIQDNTPQAADYSPVQSLRNWERQGEENIVNKLEESGLLASSGPVEKILGTVINNILVTNDLRIDPEVRARVLLTLPLETFTVGHTIVISRGLLDTLPDEASLAAMLCHELAHVALGSGVDTKFAFADRTNFSDKEILRRFRLALPQEQEDAANTKALELLQKSPYGDKTRQAGMFLKALGAESNRLPGLIKPLFGSRMADGSNVLRLASLLQSAPELQPARTDQVAALPIGARTKLDPWTSELRMARTLFAPLLSAREKMPFEITPVFLHLTYKNEPEGTADHKASTGSK